MFLFPHNESERIAALHSLNVLDTPAEKDFDDLTDLAREICQTPIALISLLDTSRQWFKSRIGISAPETPRDVSFCQYAILGTEMFVVQDALKDERFANNPLVTGEPFIRFYAGVPLINEEGLALGTFCVIDKEPRELTELQKKALETLARQVVAQLTLKSQAAGLARLNKSLGDIREQYQIVTNSASDVILTIDERGNVIFVNSAVERIFGYKIEEVLDKPLTILMPERLRAAHSQGLRNYLETNRRNINWSGTEIVGRHRDGTEFPIEISFGEYRQNGNRVFTGVIRDNRKRKADEEALRKSEKRYRFLAETVPQQVWTAKADGRIDYGNHRASEYFGEEVKISMQGEGWLSIIHPEDKAKCIENWTIALQNGTPYEVEFRLRRFDGEFRWHLAQALPMRDENGNIVKWFGTNTDIHDRKLADEALRKSEEYRNLFQHASDAILIFDPETENVLDVNERACEIYGLSREDFLGKSLKDISRDSSKGESHLIRMLEDGVAQEFETVQFRSDGMPIYFLVNSSVIDYQGKKAVLTINRDITTRKLAEDALLKSEQMLNLVMDTIPQAVFWKDRNSVYLGCNRVLAELMGFASPSEIFGKTDYDLPISKAAADTYRATDKLVMETGNAEYHLIQSFTLPSGETSWIDTNKVPLRDSAGNIIGVLGTFDDITYRRKAEHERRILEEQLRQSQKMESIGTLAGGVAHDFNNLLTVITGNTQLALLKLHDADAMQRRLDEIGSAASRAASLTRQLLAFSRRQQLQRENVELKTVIAETLELLKRLIGEHIEIVNEADETLPPIFADRNQLEQVIMNLAINARDAMADGGRLTIKTRGVVIENDSMPNQSGIKPGRYAQILITDTGVGMTPEVKERIFEPFFTTKEVGAGTGLGLSMVYGIVKQHEGHIEVCSEPGEGTTFKIHLPILETVKSKEKSKENNLALSGNETILIAEDEAPLREMMQEILAELGYKVLLAADGAEFVETYRRFEQEIDLVMIDLVMPKLSGLKAYEQICESNEAVPVIFMTGYSDKIFAEQELWEKEGSEIKAFLQKPYSIETLGAKVRQILNSQQVLKNDAVKLN